MRKKYRNEICISMLYSLFGSFGLGCVLEVGGMMLSRWEYPYRMPAFIVFGVLMLAGCITLFVREFSRMSVVAVGMRILIRICTVLLTFIPFLCLWFWLITLAENAIS